MKNNNPFLAGIPDCWYSGISTDLWIEYKYLSITKPREPVIPHLSIQQLYWIKERLAEGRSIWVVVGYKKGVVVYTELKNMEQGFTPEEFIERTITRKELGYEITTYCGPSSAVHSKEREFQECS